MSPLKARAMLKIKQLNICENINVFKDLLYVTQYAKY